MTLSLKHFDTHTGEWLKDPTKNNQVFSEELTGTWLEAKFPGVEFSIAHMDETTTEDELINNHPENHRLFLATPSGLLIYAPEQDLPKIEEAFPDKTHRIAYSSIFKGECVNIVEQSSKNETQQDYKIPILIIDDETGDSGGFLPADVALGLIGDGHGKSSSTIASMTNSDNCMVQFRLGLPKLNMQAKGTFAPCAMEELPWNNEEKAELIVPISCFKGNKPKPGLYTTDIWLGEKNRSEKGKIASSSLMPFYTEGLQDVLPTLDANAKKLVELQNNLIELAEFYCERYEQRKEQTQQRWFSDEENVQGEDEEEFVDSGIYLTIKAAIDSGDPSMLEMAPIVKELQDFVARSWKQIAIGKDPDLNWDRVMILPSIKLEQGIILTDVEVGGVKYDRLVASEIGDPSYDEGEILLAYRAPVFDKDNVGVFVNKHIPDCLDLDGKPLIGVTAVSSLGWKTLHERVEQRINTAITPTELAEIKLQSLNSVLKDLNPSMPNSSTKDINLSKVKEIAQTYDLDTRTLERDYLNQCLDGLKEKGVDLKATVPVQTVCELQASDFDGDCIGITRAKDFPHIFAETVKQSQSEFCRDPITKFPKELFDPSLTVEEIAIHMYDPPVGLINYSGTTLKSLRSELDLIQQYGSPEDKASYLKEVTSSASKKLYKSTRAIEQGKPDPISPESRPILTKLADLKNQNFSNMSQDKSEFNGEQKMAGLQRKFNGHSPNIFNQGRPFFGVSSEIFGLYSSLLRHGISIIDQENQVAVDGMKSARSPDMGTVDSQRKAAHRSVKVTSQKKQYGIYAHKPIDPEAGCSPLELIASNTNVYWQQAKLTPRSLEQFKDLFPEIYTREQKSLAQQAKLEYDLVFNQATKLAQKERNEEGAFLIVSDGQKEIPITNLKDFNHPLAYSREPLQIKLAVVDDDKKDYHKFVAYAAPLGSASWEPLGTVCEIARENLNLQPGYTFNATSVTLHNPTKTSDLLFARAREIATEFRESIPTEERIAIAAAVGHLCTTREDGKPTDQPLKNSRFMFAAFPEETADYIRNPAITNFLTKVRSDTEVVNVPKNETVTFQVGLLPNGKNQTLDVLCGDEQFRPFAALLEDSPQLVPGTRVKGQVVSSLNSTLKLQVDLPSGTKDLFFGKVDQYELSNSDLILNGQKVKVTLKEETIKKPTFVLTQDGKVVGTLTSESVDKLRDKNCLTMGRTFDLTAQTTGKNYSTQVNLTSASGNQLKLTGINPTVPRFQGDEVKLTLSQRTKEIPCTKVHLEIDGKNYCAGEFTTSANSKASVALLKEAGLFGDGKTFSAKLFSPESLLQIKIDRDTLDFPEVPPPIKFKESLNPSLLSIVPSKDKPALQLAVDSEIAPQTFHYLKKNGIKPLFIDCDIDDERSRGYRVLQMGKDTVPEAVMEQLTRKLGEPIDRTTNEIEYREKLHSVARLDNYTPTQRQQRLLTELKSNPTIFSKTLEPRQHQDGTDQDSSTLVLAIDRLKADKVIDNLQNKGANPIVVNPLNLSVREETKRGYLVIRLDENELSEALSKKLVEQLGEPIDRTQDETEYHKRLQQIPKKPGIKSDYLDGLKEFLDSREKAEISANFLASTPEFDLSTSVFIKNIKPSEEIKELMSSVKEHYGGKGVVELYDNEDGSDGKLLTFSFKTEAGRNRAIEELGLPLFFDSIKEFCAAVPYKDAELFMAKGIEKTSYSRRSPPGNSEITDISLNKPYSTKNQDEEIMQSIPVIYQELQKPQELQESLETQDLWESFESQDLREPKTYVLSYKGIVLGELDQASIDFLAEKGKLEAGKAFKVTAATQELDGEISTKFTSASGKSIQVVNSTDAKRFEHEEINVVLEEGSKSKVVQSPVLNSQGDSSNQISESQQSQPTTEATNSTEQNNTNKSPEVITPTQVIYSSETTQAKQTAEIQTTKETEQVFINEQPPGGNQDKMGHLLNKTLASTGNSLTRCPILSNHFVAPTRQATQLIAFPAKEKGKSLSAKELKKWGDKANTGEYSQDDLILIVGDSPGRTANLKEIKVTFDDKYQPLIDKAIASGAQFLLGDAEGIDKLAQEYLKEKGFTKESNGSWVQQEQILSELSPENEMELESLPPPPTLREKEEEQHEIKENELATQTNQLGLKQFVAAEITSSNRFVAPDEYNLDSSFDKSSDEIKFLANALNKEFNSKAVMETDFMGNRFIALTFDNAQDRNRASEELDLMTDFIEKPMCLVLTPELEKIEQFIKKEMAPVPVSTQFETSEPVSTQFETSEPFIAESEITTLIPPPPQGRNFPTNPPQIPPPPQGRNFPTNPPQIPPQIPPTVIEEHEEIESPPKPKLIKKVKQFLGQLGQKLQGNEPQEFGELTTEETEKLNSTSKLEKFLTSELTKSGGVFLVNDPKLDPSLDKFSDEVKFFVNSVNKTFGSSASVEFGNYNDGQQDSKVELLTFTFNSQEERDKAAKELGLVVLDNGQISPECKASIGGIKAIEQFIKDEVARIELPKQTPALNQVIKPLDDDFSLDDIVDEKDKKTMETIREVRQQQRTQEVAPIVALELRSDRATHKEGDRFILDYDSTDKLLSVIDKEINLPVMLAKPIGRDKDNNVVWESQPLPKDSPGLTTETVEGFKELKLALEAEKLEGEKYLKNRQQTER